MINKYINNAISASFVDLHCVLNGLRDDSCLPDPLTDMTSLVLCLFTELPHSHW